MKNVPFFKRHELRSAALCAIAFVAISGVLFSCAKEELDYGKLNLIGDPKPITVNATLPKSASLDKTLVASDGKVKWESSDQIIVNGTALGIASISASGTEAVFSGSVGAINRPDGNAYWATYPTSLAPTNYTASSVNVTLPSTQTYNGDHIPSYMAAFNTVDGDNLDLQFKNLCCMLKFQVKSQDNGNQSTNKLSKIEVVSNQYIAGTAMVQMDGSGNPAFTSWTNGGKILTLNCGNTQLNNGAGVIFSVMLPAGTQSLSVKFYDATGKYMRKTVSGASLARSCMYNLSATLNATEVSGLFSVSSTKKVYFSPGNLQWTSTGTHAVAGGGTADGTWRFAEHQYDYIGSANSNISASYTGWIDLLGWGTSGWNNGNTYYQPYDSDSTTSANAYGYGPRNGTSYSNGLTGTYANADWGVYNAIYNPRTGQTDTAGTWRTMTKDEWVYLLGVNGNGRSSGHADWWIFNMVKITDGEAQNVRGAIIYPDGVTEKPAGVSAPLIKESNTTGITIIDISEADLVELEAAGCAFLPAAGYRDKGIQNVGYICTYWSSTNYYTSAATNCYFHFYNKKVNPSNNNPRYTGRSVRLVQDAN